mgnify:CR=1 FL=1
MSLDEVKKKLAGNRTELDRFGVKSLSIFGSFARGQAGAASDVDLLVEFSIPVGLFAFIRLKHHLETLLGLRVDLVTPDALKESLREAILKEAIRAA